MRVFDMARKCPQPKRYWRPRLDVLEARRLLSVWADFNNDGYSDLAIGVPSEMINGSDMAGAVNVLYGRPSGLSATGNQFWHQDSPYILGVAQYGDGFGDALAAGDFNGDGFGDLAVGVPFEDVDGKANAGAVNVLYGTAEGLTATGNQYFHQDKPNIPGIADVDDFFGYTLAAGDFDGDSDFDLAIGTHYDDDATGKINVGTVNVLHGSPSGLTATGSQLLSQDTSGVPGTAEAHDWFGWSLAAGDFDGDSRDDLAVGVYGEKVGAVWAGAVNVLYGSTGGLSGAGSQFWYQGHSGILDSPEYGDTFGYSLATGDFNGDARDDLAVGIIGESVGSIEEAGAVSVIYGASGGLSAFGNQLFHQDTPNVGSGAEVGDHFGHDLVAADFNGNGRSDLAIGVLWEDVGAVEDAGAVNVLYGTASGLNSAGSLLYTQENWGVAPEAGDHFSYSLAAGDFSGGGWADLAIGAPCADVGSVANGGAVYVVNNATSQTFQTWHQSSFGILDSAETGDWFGGALAGGGGGFGGGGTGPSGGSGFGRLGGDISSNAQDGIVIAGDAFEATKGSVPAAVPTDPGAPADLVPDQEDSSSYRWSGAIPNGKKEHTAARRLARLVRVPDNGIDDVLVQAVSKC